MPSELFFCVRQEFTKRREHVEFYAIFNSQISSTTRVAKWLLALQPFRFVVTHITGEENVDADRLSPIPWPVAKPKAVDVIQLAGELELASAGEEESDSDSEKEGEECFLEDNSAQEEVILFAFDMLKQHQKADTDFQSLAQ